LDSLTVNSDDGFDLLENILLLKKVVPDTNINEKICGIKYKPFIAAICNQYNLVESNNMPYTHFNLRHGVRSSIVGMVSEYISLQVTHDLFGNGVLVQDAQSQMSGVDILYHQNGNEITADVKTAQSMDTLYCHSDWFNKTKTSTRLHIVNLKANKHYIIGRSYFESMFLRHGNHIPINDLKKYGYCKITDIQHLTKNIGTI
jgi:hypothetical protein